LVHAKIPRHGKVDMLQHNQHEMFNNVPKNFTATRYHSLVLQELPECLVPTAFCNEEIMALAHRNLQIWGIQFHPESCQTLHGLNIIHNFVALVKTIKC
jgi:anthranilate/para-aminobenzoate synthase component II